MFTPVILAGGSGSRLWPLSRQHFPKQFLELDGQAKGTMFQRTLARLDGLGHASPLIVSNEEHRFVVAEQLRQAKRTSRRIILEPMARNTAPAITLAALEACREGDDPILLVLAADHYIRDEAAFREALLVAEAQAREGRARILAVTTAARIPALPDVPAAVEIIPGYIAPNWFAIAAPNGLPAPILARLTAELTRLRDDGDFRARFATLGAEPLMSTPDILAGRLAEDVPTWRRVAAEAGIRAE